MRPKDHPKTKSQAELFRSKLTNILDHRHPMFSLAQRIEWSVFEAQFGPLYDDGTGRPGIPIRVMVALHYLKHIYDESDESVVEKFLENPYWQYFCGFEFFQHEPPIEPSSMTRWRRRVGEEGAEKLLQETVAAAKRAGQLKRVDVERVNVDTTVQEKAIAHPTDARLYHKARRRLVREAKRRGIELRQSYARLSRWALFKQSRYAHAQQFRRARRETRKLRTFLGRVIRDLRRRYPEPDEKLFKLLSIAERIHGQQRDDKGKVYSLWAPEVECISKGKAHKKYEFGCKVSVATTSKKSWVVGIRALHGNPYDGHTLNGSLAQVKTLTGWKPRFAFCDKGYRGVTRTIPRVKVLLSGKRHRSRPLRRWMRRRAAIEPVIGHMKSEHGMDRNHLAGPEGDVMNALFCGSAFNLKKLMRVLVRAADARLRFLFAWIWCWYRGRISSSYALDCV
jgi:IS5 family transposase